MQVSAQSLNLTEEGLSLDIAESDRASAEMALGGQRRVVRHFWLPLSAEESLSSFLLVRPSTLIFFSVSRLYGNYSVDAKGEGFRH